MKNLKSQFLSVSSKINNDSSSKADTLEEKSIEQIKLGSFSASKASDINKEKRSLVPNILEHNLEEWKEKVYSIAILLTGCADDAEFVAQEVMESLSEFNYTNQDYNITKFEEKIRKLAYDASIERLFNQVKSKAENLEDAGNNILEKQNYIN